MRHLLTLFTFSIAVLLSVQVSARELTVFYHERPPYMYLDQQGTLQGITGRTALAALQASEHPIQLRNLPAPRQLATLEANAVKACAIGWFKTSQRQQYLQYSLPIYNDQATVAIAHYANPKLQSSERADRLLARNDITALTKTSYSYGDYLDPLLQNNPRVQRVSADNQTMLTMIASQRIDLMFIAPEEFAGLLKDSSYSAQDFRVITLTDISAGTARYIVCSQQVSTSTMEHINNWIKHHVVAF